MLDATGRHLSSDTPGFHTDGRRTDDLTPLDASALARIGGTELCSRLRSAPAPRPQRACARRQPRRLLLAQGASVARACFPAYEDPDSSLVRRSGCLPMRFRRVRDQDRRSLEAAVVKQNDNAFGAGSAVLGLAEVSPAVSAMERAALHVRLGSLPPGARCWAGRRRAHPDRRPNPTASRRKSSGCGGLVFGTLDLGSMDAVGQGRDRPPSPGAGPWPSWGDLA